MSVALRVIPRLDIKGPNLVKGINLEGLRVLGKPEQFAEYYYQQGADELIYQDVVASLYGRNSLQGIVERTARGVFIPLTVGGGIRSLDDISAVLRAGADKVAINTAAINNPDLIREASLAFGASTVVVSIEAIRQPEGDYLAFTDNGRNHTGLEVVEWARRAEGLGAGEILLTSVDQEGTGRGFDVGLAKRLAEAVSIPVVVHGGAGEVGHVVELAEGADISGVAMASILHYDFITENRQLEGYEDEGNIDFLKGNRGLSNIKTEKIAMVKEALVDRGFVCRSA